MTASPRSGGQGGDGIIGGHLEVVKGVDHPCWGPNRNVTPNCSVEIDYSASSQTASTLNPGPVKRSPMAGGRPDWERGDEKGGTDHVPTGYPAAVRTTSQALPSL